jgi:hypothetical protein
VDCLNDPATRKLKMKREHHENKKISKHVTKQKKDQSISNQKAAIESYTSLSIEEQLDVFASLLIGQYLKQDHEKK